MLFINADYLRHVAEKILKKLGSEAEEAAIVAEHLITANLCGHDSHGIGMLPIYVEKVSLGRLKPNTPVKCLKEDGSILIFDGQRGYGQRTASVAMDAAIARCKETGLALMVLRNAHHIGRIGSYGEQSIRAGLISIHFVNVVDHDPVVVPFGGRHARFSTNPICIAIPGTDSTAPVLLDMATSTIPLGKARVAMNANKKVEDNRIVDADGNPTNDPSVLFHTPMGALVAFGLHKGSGVALLCELLAGVVGGGGTIQPENERMGGIINNMLVLILNPRRIGDSDWMNREFDALINYVKNSPPYHLDNPVMVPGDPERKAYAERLKNGIPLSRSAWDRIIQAGEAVGVLKGELENMIS
jgi:uncharacterized oxidoreductase